MRELRSEAELPGSPERVWALLTDFDSFPSWNPFIRYAAGPLVPGGRLTIRLRLGPALVTFRPVVTALHQARELRWTARQRPPGVFDVDRRFRLEPVGGDRCRLVQSETATGLLAPVLLPVLGPPIVAGYRALEGALARRLVAAQQYPGGPDRSGRADPDGQTTDSVADPAGPAGSRRRRGGDMTGRKITVVSQRTSSEDAPAAPAAPAPPTASPQPAWKRRINSHEGFSHDSIDSLGYDWERIANPAIPPVFPRKIYLPRTTADIVAAVLEARSLGEQLTIRSKGHSSNSLVLSDGGAVLLMEKLDGIVEVDEEAMTATVQAGAISAQVDDHLAARGLGLPVIGDHNHITVGGFASVGGISPASHRFGLFIDTVQRLEYVTWDGQVVTCSREENSGDFHKVLAGLGRHGVLATLTVRIIRVDKYGTVLKNSQEHHYDVERFIEGSAKAIRDPGNALMERGVWVDFPLPRGRSLGVGQFSAYRPIEQSRYAKLRDATSYNALHGIGFVAGRLPARVDRLLKYVGMSGVLFSPTYATMKNVEFFTDKILDSSVGDPTRMFIVLAPLDRYERIFRETYELMREFRRERDCFTFISVYVKSIKSDYLAQGRADNRFCELMFYQGMSAGGMDPAVLEELVTRLDDICIAHEGFRYMHTKTSADPARREKVDPNVYWTRRAESAAPRREEVLDVP